MNLTSNKINDLYNKIYNQYNCHLKQYNVKMPKLYLKGNYTLNSLVLIYLYSKVGQIVSKQELTDFLRTMGFEVNDVQQARHLAQQSGWYILSGTRGDYECKQLGIKSGEYMLKTIEKPYPSYKKLKRTDSLNANSWDELKKIYNYRCVTCGSKENEPNFLYPSSSTMLQKGHKDPSQPLTLENTIPQCQFCNRASRDYFVFDNKGRVEKISDPRFVLKSKKEVQLAMLKLLISNNYEEAKKIINNLYKEH